MPEMLIGGEWCAARSGEELDVLDPATEETVATVPRAARADVDAAVGAALGAFPAWSRTDPEARAAILRRGIELLDANRERLVDTLVHEQGKPTFEASGELDHLIHGLRYYADLEYAVNATTFGAFLHQGQICMSARRIIVERPIADAFVSRLADKTSGLKVGDPNEHDTIIGPVINPEALETIKARVDAAVASGARVLAGGSAEGPCFQATLLADVPRDSEFANVETFGPVAAIEIVDTADEAVERANATPYGLSSGIITTDVERGMALAQAIDAGIVHVNDQPVGDEPQMPFGGVKDSGFGRFGGTAVVDEFTETRWITVQRGSHPFPF